MERRLYFKDRCLSTRPTPDAQSILITEVDGDKKNNNHNNEIEQHYNGKNHALEEAVCTNSLHNVNQSPKVSASQKKACFDIPETVDVLVFSCQTQDHFSDASLSTVLPMLSNCTVKKQAYEENVEGCSEKELNIQPSFEPVSLVSTTLMLPIVSRQGGGPYAKNISSNLKAEPDNSEAECGFQFPSKSENVLLDADHIFIQPMALSKSVKAKTRLRETFQQHNEVSTCSERSFATISSSTNPESLQHSFSPISSSTCCSSNSYLSSSSCSTLPSSRRLRRTTQIRDALTKASLFIAANPLPEKNVRINALINQSTTYQNTQLSHPPAASPTKIATNMQQRSTPVGTTTNKPHTGPPALESRLLTSFGLLNDYYSDTDSHPNTATNLYPPIHLSKCRSDCVRTIFSDDSGCDSCDLGYFGKLRGNQQLLDPHSNANMVLNSCLLNKDKTQSNFHGNNQNLLLKANAKSKSQFDQDVLPIRNVLKNIPLRNNYCLADNNLPCERRTPPLESLTESLSDDLKKFTQSEPVVIQEDVLPRIELNSLQHKNMNNETLQNETSNSTNNWSFKNANNDVSPKKNNIESSWITFRDLQQQNMNHLRQRESNEEKCFVMPMQNSLNMNNAENVPDISKNQSSNILTNKITLKHPASIIPLKQDNFSYIQQLEEPVSIEQPSLKKRAASSRAGNMGIHDNYILPPPSSVTKQSQCKNLSSSSSTRSHIHEFSKSFSPTAAAHRVTFTAPIIKTSSQTQTVGHDFNEHCRFTRNHSNRIRTRTSMKPTNRNSLLLPHQYANHRLKKCYNNNNNHNYRYQNNNNHKNCNRIAGAAVAEDGSTCYRNIDCCNSIINNNNNNNNNFLSSHSKEMIPPYIIQQPHEKKKGGLKKHHILYQKESPVPCTQEENCYYSVTPKKNDYFKQKNQSVPIISPPSFLLKQSNYQNNRKNISLHHKEEDYNSSNSWSKRSRTTHSCYDDDNDDDDIQQQKRRGDEESLTLENINKKRCQAKEEKKLQIPSASSSSSSSIICPCFFDYQTFLRTKESRQYWSQVFIWFTLGSLLIGSIIGILVVFFTYYASSPDIPEVVDDLDTDFLDSISGGNRGGNLFFRTNNGF